jgi:hypothetical protein
MSRQDTRNIENADNNSGITIIKNKLFGPSQVAIQLDAVISEDHTSELDITQFPSESGTIYTDNAIIVPKKYTLSGVVSKIKNSTGIPSGGEKSSLDPRATYQDLVLLQQSRIPFDVVTNLFTYINLLIVSLTTKQDKNSSNILIFEAQLQQIQIAETQTILLPISKITPTKKDSGASQEDQGTKSKDDIGKVDDPINQSVLSKLTTGTSNFFRG